MDDIGLGRPAELIDLEMPTRWLVGDEEIIEWVFVSTRRPCART
jgi:hypothetical protein